MVLSTADRSEHLVRGFGRANAHHSNFSVAEGESVLVVVCLCKFYFKLCICQTCSLSCCFLQFAEQLADGLMSNLASPGEIQCHSIQISSDRTYRSDDYHEVSLLEISIQNSILPNNLIPPPHCFSVRRMKQARKHV
ncbi:hypothetical protein T01_9730 [Trichinella spiralis]|uniref:Uncharacterized protein n=1 Tax=Trichinella spiralis TaxID=6334 RepID=A0A0V1BK74_TRISP|nr:hypothetical protein T01_9730 [Trichinella spiralis]